MNATWRCFVKSSQARPSVPCFVDTKALAKGKFRIVRDKDGCFQLVGEESPRTRESMLVSLGEAIDLAAKFRR